MINMENLTVKMLQTLFPDVASPGFDNGMLIFGFVVIGALVLFVLALIRKWHESWAFLSGVVFFMSLLIFGVLTASRYDTWRQVTLPGALSRDHQAAIVLERVRRDIKWINERAAARAREKADGK